MIRQIRSMLHPVKKITSWVIDNTVTKKLSEFEKTVIDNFNDWYRSTLVNVAVVSLLIVAGFGFWFFNDTTGILRLLVAVAYVFSIGVFIYRRIRNILYIKNHFYLISYYGKITWDGAFLYPFGSKTRRITYDIYSTLYSENLGSVKSFLHKIAAFVRLVPDKDGVFDILYANLVLFFWRVIFLRAIMFAVFIVLFTALCLFVKNSVLLEMHFSNVFETLLYPFIYFRDLFTAWFRI